MAEYPYYPHYYERECPRHGNWVLATVESAAEFVLEHAKCTPVIQPPAYKPKRRS